MDLKFSIIIPYFNPPVERFINCINSVLQQSYTNYEIILINDGSNEKYEPILAKLKSRQDAEFKEVRQPNRGVSSARNAGTSIATGDYVMYLDADDELPTYVLAEAAQLLEDNKVDVILGYVQYIKSVSDKQGGISNPSYYEESPIVLRDYHFAGDSAVLNWRLSKRVVLKNGPVARLVKRDLAMSVPFPDGVSISEDTLWNIELFDKANSAMVVEEIWYWYWVSHSSASRCYNLNAVQDIMEFKESLSNLISKLSNNVDRSLICARLLGEFNRVIKTYYVYKEGFIGNIISIRRLFMELNSPQLMKLQWAIQKDLKTAVKYLSCKSGIVYIYWKLKSMNN